MGLLAYRNRLRVVIAATIAGGTIAFLVAGMGGFMTVVDCAYIGGLTGIVKRRGKGAPTAFAAALVAGAAFGVFGVTALLVFSRLRNLIFESMTANVDGLVTVLGVVPAFDRAGQLFKGVFTLMLQFWPVLIMASSIFSIAFVTMVGWWALSRVLARLSGVPDVHKLDFVDETGPAEPVPAVFRDVRFRYPGAHHDAVGPVTLTVERGEHLAITGANGSGKTTLMLLMSGREPTAGTSDRPGAIGLGRFGGTAVVHAAPRESGAGYPRRRRRRLGASAWCDGRRGPAAGRGRAGRAGRTRHRRVVRRRTATPRRRRRARARAGTADRRRGHQHGRPEGSRRSHRRAVGTDRTPRHVAGAHHPLQRRGRLRRPRRSTSPAIPTTSRW